MIVERLWYDTMNSPESRLFFRRRLAPSVQGVGVVPKDAPHLIRPPFSGGRYVGDCSLPQLPEQTVPTANGNVVAKIRTAKNALSVYGSLLINI